MILRPHFDNANSMPLIYLFDAISVIKSIDQIHFDTLVNFGFRFTTLIDDTNAVNLLALLLTNVKMASMTKNGEKYVNNADLMCGRVTLPIGFNRNCITMSAGSLCIRKSGRLK